MPGAYITVEDVRNLSPGVDPSPAANTIQLYSDVLANVLRRIDRKTGQFFYGGVAAGTYTPRRLEVQMGGRMLVIPRFQAIDSVENRRSIGSDWETVDSDDYETSAEKEAWAGSGIDTIRFKRRYYGEFRITGNLGWGHDDFTDDPVPEDLPLEARKAVRYKTSRIPIGGSTGNEIMAADMAIEMGGWEFPWAVKCYLDSLVDVRRLMGG